MARTYKRRGTVRKTRKRGGMSISTNEFNAAWKERQMNQPSFLEIFASYKQRAADFYEEQAKLKEEYKRRNAEEEEKRRVLEEDLLRPSPSRNTTKKKKKKKKKNKQKKQTPKATNEEQKEDEETPEEQKLDEETPEEQSMEEIKHQPKQRIRIKSDERKDKIKQSKLLKSLLQPISHTYDFTQWNFLKETGKLDDIFFIPNNESFLIQQQNGLISTSKDESEKVNSFLISILSIYGKLSELFHRHKFPYQIVFKGTRALELATKTRIETRDIDISFIRLTEEPDEREILATNVAKIIQYICGHEISILKQTSRDDKPPLCKISIVIRPRIFIPLSDIGYADEEIIKKKYVTVEKGEFYFVAPDFISLLREKLKFYDRYTTNKDEQGKYDIKKGLCKFKPFLEKYSNANANRVREICKTDSIPSSSA